MTLRSICGIDCERCFFKERCGGCSLCEAAICSNICRKCGALCPKRGAAVIHLRMTMDLDEEIRLVGNRRCRFPYHIPVLPDRLNSGLRNEVARVIGIHGENFLSTNGTKIRNIYKKNGFRRALNLDESVQAILQFYVKDKALEGFWDNRQELYDELMEQHLQAIIVPNFSVYEDAPRMDHLYNIQRSIIVYKEMREKGMEVIPDVAWYNLEDLDIWIELINSSDIKTIAFSFQVVDVRLKASNAWKHYLLGFRYLCSSINNVDIIVVGASSEKKAIEIKKAASKNNIRLSFINQAAYVQSRRGMRSEGRTRDISTPRDKLLEENIIYFNNLYKKINEDGVI